MPLQLKLYQQTCLQKLDDCLAAIVANTPLADAFFSIAHRNYLTITGLENVPYLCLRVPTGGGKTILAAHAIPLIAKRLLRQDRSLVLWLAPTNTIVDQTAAALKNRGHPYRQALDTATNGNISVFTGPEALYLPKPDLDANTVIIVSTLAALRVTDTEGRKFYEANGALMPHFTGLPEVERDALAAATDPDLRSPSLANLIRLRRPIVIMDEAHNARTPLSFGTLQRFAPCCILELTATPATVHNPKKDEYASNVLHHVSALELKEEQMIKLPIKVRCQPQWKQAVQDAIKRRHNLEELAKKEQAISGEYIRPIILFQAQNDSDDPEAINPEKLKAVLIADFNIPADQIAIATGSKDELAKVKNILTPDCPIRYIATIQKLKEGWDCPFAYVLCTLTNISSRGAVEQFLGRILRLPRATKKAYDALNHAYAYVTSKDTHATTLGLTELLEEKAGFSKFDASQSITADTEPSGGAGPLFQDADFVTLQATPDFSHVTVDLQAKFSFDPDSRRLTWEHSTPINNQELTVLKKGAKTDSDRKSLETLAHKTRKTRLSPASQGELFAIPQLGLRSEGQISLFEDQFREVPWDLAKADPILADADFVLPSANTQTAVVDIASTGKLQANFITELQQQVALFDYSFQTLPELVSWLARTIPAPDVTPSQKDIFLRALVKGLIDLRQFTMEQLIGARFSLADAAARRIEHHRRASLKSSYQKFLLPSAAAPLEVSPNIAFTFPLRSVYPAPSIYQGPIAFNKHYYNNIADMNGEEAQCALAIDSHPKVKFWVRNLERPDFAFWLPTSDDRFYPDFVALLTEGRYLACEYKGAHLLTSADTLEKREIGELWQARSNNACLFLLASAPTLSTFLNAI